MGQTKIDLLSAKTLCYDNAFVLFADATTYETESYTECVLDTKAGGKGYYFTGGGYEEISWGYDNEGNLCFFGATGEKLVINRGSSYISFVKSSEKNNVKIS